MVSEWSRGGLCDSSEEMRKWQKLGGDDIRW